MKKSSRKRKKKKRTKKKRRYSSSSSGGSDIRLVELWVGTDARVEERAAPGVVNALAPPKRRTRERMAATTDFIVYSFRFIERSRPTIVGGLWQRVDRGQAGWA